MLRAAFTAGFVATMLLGGIAGGNLAVAADADLKAEIETYIQHVQLSSDSRLHWDGADSFDVRTSGDTATATLVNARFSFRQDPAEPKPLASVTLDRIEILRKPSADGAKLTEYAMTLPALSTIVGANGIEIALSLKEARASALVEQPGEHQRTATLNIAAGRIEDKNGKSWGSFGPFTAGWKIVRGDDGSWRAPFELELKKVEFLIAEAPLAGAVERIAYSGEAAGPDLAALDALRDQTAEIREEGNQDKKIAGWLSLLPKALTVFSNSKGELTAENLSARKPGGETQVTLAKATMGGSLTGLGGDKAALRITVRDDGLTIAPSLVPEAQVPSRLVLDFGLEDVAVGTLRTLAEAGSQVGPDAGEAERQKAIQQIIGAAMTLSPVFRIYDAAVDFKNVNIDATGEAKRAPPLPIGYTATGDVGVRGFEHLPEIVTAGLARAYLPLVKLIGSAETAAGGAPVTKFHLTSAIGQPFTVNGSNLAAWFAGHGPGGQGPGQPRTLRLADPPLSGDDVSAVQKALGSQKNVPADGKYDTATALAVAEFQKQSGLNVDGVVDAATRDKLGIKPPRPLPLPPHPGPKN